MLYLLTRIVDKHGDYVPFAKVSGMPSDDPSIILPWQHPLVGSKEKLGLLMWGSPHPCTSDNSAAWAWNGSAFHDHTPKTEAFETMMWMTTGIVVMTFATAYRCEFYQPQWNLNSSERHLIIGRAHMKNYAPMRSCAIKVDKITEKDDVIAALAVPFRHVSTVVWTKDGLIDFGKTLRAMLFAVKKEKLMGVALGTYAANLEVEVVS